MKEAAEAAAINDSLIRSFRESFLDPYFRTPAGKAADTVLRVTGFSMVERWNRLWAFHASSNYAMKQLTKGVANRLKGNALDITRRRFQGMGQNFDELVKLAKAEPGRPAQQVESLLMKNEMSLMKDIGLGGVQQTQFLPDKTRLPTFWNTPAGRVAFQFKSFALNQARLVRDRVVAEAAKGNAAPLLYMMATYPIGGEMVITLKQLIRDGELDRPGSPLARYIEDFAAVGGFGLAGDLYRAATWGPEQLYRALVGPTAEDGAYALNALVTRDFDRIAARASKLPTFQAALTLGTLGLGLGMEGVPKLAAGLEHFLQDETEEPTEVAPMLPELQAQARGTPPRY